MMRCYAARLLALSGAFAPFFAARPALAEDLSCLPMAIEADASVNARWPRLSDRVREAFDARDDIDTCARLKLRMSEASIVVEVVLPDGRSASRSLRRPEDVVPTVEALLLLPEQEEPVHAAPDGGTSAPLPAASAPLPASGDVSLSAGPAVKAREAPTGVPGHEPSRLRIELSILSGARVGDGQMSVGLGALSFVDIDGWLVGFEGRVDRYRTIGNPGDGGALELAALGGRRLRFGTVSLESRRGA